MKKYTNMFKNKIKNNNYNDNNDDKKIKTIIIYYIAQEIYISRRSITRTTNLCILLSTMWST
jgi:hypothetical protein